MILRLCEIKSIAAGNLIDAKYRSKSLYDRKINPFDGKVGDNVYVKRDVKTNNLDSKCHGLYRIIDTLDEHTAILEITEGKRFQKHLDKLKVAHE